MNNELRALQIEARLLGLGRVAFQLHMAQVHTQNRTYHLMEALDLAADDYFGQALADKIRDLVYGPAMVVAA